MKLLERVSQTKHRLFLSAAFGVALVYCLCLIFTPRWQTNDDAGMSMVLHGYGLAATAMPNLIYSNIFWGYFLSHVPNVNGVLGYSVATVATLALCGMFMAFFSSYFHGRNWCLPLIIILVLSRPIIFPHFTINAGLLTVCAVIGMRAYVVLQNRWILAVSFVLLFFGSLIRQNEAFLVLLVTSPLFITRKLLFDRRFQSGLLIYIAALFLATVVDHYAYAGEDWRAFNKLAKVIGPYVDFGAGVRIEGQPEIYSKYGFSKNDVELVRNWFFVDSQIANPTVLQKMLSDLGPLPGQPGSYASGYAVWMSLLEKPLLPMFAAALVGLLCHFNLRLLSAWCIFLLSLFLFGFSGRAVTMHVYLPPLAALLLLAPQASSSRVLMAVCLVIATIGNFTILHAEQMVAEQEMASTEKNVASLLGTRVVYWGDYFNFQNIFPVLSSNAKMRELSIYSLGAFTLAPFSTTAKAEMEGAGMKTLLPTSEGVQILVGEYGLNLLRIYCKERKWGELRTVTITDKGLPLRRVNCTN